MYLARPPISPDPHKQLATKPSVPLHRGAGNVTTTQARDPDQIRHPVTRKFLSKWQNEQSSSGPSEETRVKGE